MTSSHVSPAARAIPALMAGLCPFNPDEATLAPGPKIPPVKSESRVGVCVSVRPPGGPDRNLAIAENKS